VNARRVWLVLVLSGVVGAVGGCPSAHLPKAPSGPPPSLVGAWQSDCLPTTNADDTDGSMRVIYGMTSSLWALDTRLFGDGACVNPVGTLHTDGGWAFERASTTVPGAWEVRFDVRTRNITPHDEGFIAYLESVGCGRDYGLDRTSDLLDLSCPALGVEAFAVCQAEFDVVAADGPALRFGARGIGRNRCDARARPPTLGPLLRPLQ
jgi:hypothetical protein